MPPRGGFNPPICRGRLSPPPPKGVVLSPYLVIGGILSPIFGDFILVLAGGGVGPSQCELGNLVPE